MFCVVSITALSCPVGAGVLNGSQCEVSGSPTAQPPTTSPTQSMCQPGMAEDVASC